MNSFPFALSPFHFPALPDYYLKEEKGHTDYVKISLTTS